MRLRLQNPNAKLVPSGAKAALAVIAAALFLQGCGTNYYACRQEGTGREACDDMSHGRMG